MTKRTRPRFGSLQYWPRKRARKALPRVNWDNVRGAGSANEGLLGFIGYKVGMASAVVKDETDKSMTKGKKIVIPVTILEVPKMKIFSVRFYNKGNISKEVVVSNERILKKKVKVPKEAKKLDGDYNYDEIRLIMYSSMGKGRFKKSPDLAEIAFNGENALEKVKTLIGKEISVSDILKWQLVDVRGLTRGKGLQGPVKRFGITLKAHKSEKGVRRPGSLGPWHPARVTFRVPMSGQLGMLSRITHNSNVIKLGNVSEEGKDINKKEGFSNYGMVRGDYVILAGSIQGPVKRQVMLTPASRPTKSQAKKKLELLELR